MMLNKKLANKKIKYFYAFFVFAIIVYALFSGNKALAWGSFLKAENASFNVGTGSFANIAGVSYRYGFLALRAVKWEGDFSLEIEDVSDDIDFNKIDFDVQSNALMFDLYPFNGNFYLSFASVGNPLNLRTETGLTTTTLNGNPYAVGNAIITASVGLSNYYGLGYNKKIFDHLGFYFDLGVIGLERPDITINIIEAQGVTVPTADRIAAENELEQDFIDKINQYPIIQLGIRYSF